MKLRKVSLKDYKSVDHEGQEVELGNLTVLIGGNGSGKSNFISLFALLNYMQTKSLQNYIAEHGYADSFLYMGADRTPAFEVSLLLEDERSTDTYSFRMAYAAGGILIFSKETIEWRQAGAGKPFSVSLGHGHRESLLRKDDNDATVSFVFHALSRIRAFHFHNTELTARIRNPGYIDDNRFLKSDAGNLAAFLYAMREKEEAYYRRIVRHVQEVFPQFLDFDLHPTSANEDYIRLNWRAEGTDVLWGPHQISDGSLRFMALATLLLQPATTRPDVIVLDEPELGLHPTAIAKLAALLRNASHDKQIIVATQSAALLSEMAPEDVRVVDYDRMRWRSLYRSLDPGALSDWLQDYSLGQLWEKNVLGGKP